MAPVHVSTAADVVIIKSNKHVKQDLLDLDSCLQDFDSSSLKHKKHWNSFTTAFFIDVKNACAILAGDGRLTIDLQAAESMLKQDLHCHICGQKIKNLPTLKPHIQRCKP